MGSAVVGALRNDSRVEVVPVRAPRLGPIAEERAEFCASESTSIETLTELLAGVDAVVNAAGDARAASRDVMQLTATNGVLPGLIAAAASRLPNKPRLIHVSSAAVEADAKLLTAEPVDMARALSPYARSKALGEILVTQFNRAAVIYRPPGVHAHDRSITKMIGRLARSPFSSVAYPMSSPSPQALLPNVAAAIVHLATIDRSPPSIVIHPSEGISTGGLLSFLGGRQPRVMPASLARSIVQSTTFFEHFASGITPYRRRLEMLWFGQSQATSWFTESGWLPPIGHEGWRQLGKELQNGHLETE